MSDLEVEAIAAISNTFSPLDAESRSRVLRWAVEKFGIAAPIAHVTMEPGTANRPSSEMASNGFQAVAEITDVPHTIVRATVVHQEFEHLAELFDAVRPESEMDKALTAAYWEQVIQGNDSWPSASLNRGLRDMGHAIAAINKALDVAIARRPALVIQLKKNGSTQQGRKLYKMTIEGIRYIRARIESEQ